MTNRSISKVEVNFRRLLRRCEAIAQEKDYDWRFPRYVEALQSQLTELKTASVMKPAPEDLKDYSNSVEFLRNLVLADKKSSVVDRAVAADMIGAENPTLESKKIHLRTKAKYEQEMRSQLLGSGKESETILRNRLLGKAFSDGAGDNAAEMTDDRLDEQIRHHRQLHEKIAEEMLTLTHNLKANVSASNRIVIDDTKKLGDSSQLTEGNIARLRVEQERLDAENKKWCNCWIWIMCLVVCIIFAWVVLLMKLFPKSRQIYHSVNAANFKA